MGARQKLNAAYLQGTFVIAAICAAVAQSLSFGILTFIVLTIGNLLTGNIRR